LQGKYVSYRKKLAFEKKESGGGGLALNEGKRAKDSEKDRKTAPTRDLEKKKTFR